MDVPVAVAIAGCVEVVGGEEGRLVPRAGNDWGCGGSVEARGSPIDVGVADADVVDAHCGGGEVLNVEIYAFSADTPHCADVVVDIGVAWPEAVALHKYFDSALLVEAGADDTF